MTAANDRDIIGELAAFDPMKVCSCCSVLCCVFCGEGPHAHADGCLQALAVAVVEHKRQIAAADAP